MVTKPPPYKQVLKYPLRFMWRVLKGFKANQGLLLSGAVAYYALLSIIPLLTLILMALSHFVGTDLLLQTLRQNIEVIVPAHADIIVEQMSQFLNNGQVISWVLVGALLFFSSMAFTVLENAISFIFHHRVAIHRRHFLVSAILPYIYILVMGIGFFLMTLIAGIMAGVETRELSLLGNTWSLQGISRVTLYIIGLTGQILLLTSFYLVMPLGNLSLRHALVGGVTAAILWEVMRHILVWYFSTLSLVNVVYGSLGTAIVVLISLEIAGMILLFGAQVIAEYERLGLQHDEQHNGIHA
jgi:YihY family inner membrane protein